MREMVIVMQFGEAVKSGFSHYADTRGRSSQAAFWWWLLFVALALVAAAIVTLVLVGAGVTAPGAVDEGLLWPVQLLGLGLLVPTATFAVRRLHDSGQSAWWLLVALIPVLGTVVLLAGSTTAGTPGPNRYGAASDSRDPYPHSPIPQLRV
jgi:uncharacterized membrane protein YhaH (DUF805 family)